jgi:hypothetical protein
MIDIFRHELPSLVSLFFKLTGKIIIRAELAPVRCCFSFMCSSARAKVLTSLHFNSLHHNTTIYSHHKKQILVTFYHILSPISSISGNLSTSLSPRPSSQQQRITPAGNDVKITTRPS